MGCVFNLGFLVLFIFAQLVLTSSIENCTVGDAPRRYRSFSSSGGLLSMGVSASFTPIVYEVTVMARGSNSSTFTVGCLDGYAFCVPSVISLGVPMFEEEEMYRTTEQYSYESRGQHLRGFSIGLKPSVDSAPYRVGRVGNGPFKGSAKSRLHYTMSVQGVTANGSMFPGPSQNDSSAVLTSMAGDLPVVGPKLKLIYIDDRVQAQIECTKRVALKTTHRFSLDQIAVYAEWWELRNGVDHQLLAEVDQEEVDKSPLERRVTATLTLTPSLVNERRRFRCLGEVHADREQRVVWVTEAFQLDLKHAPMIQRGKDRVVLHHNAATDIRLLCDVAAYPAATFSWQRDGKNLHHITDSLVVQPTREDVVVKCRAENCKGFIEQTFVLVYKSD